MTMKVDRIAGGLKPYHGGGEEIAGDGLHDIFGKCAVPAALIGPAAAAHYP